MAGRILFDHVWKRFHQGSAHDSLRDLIPSLGRRLIGKSPDQRELGSGDFWAIRDVAFEVKPGEALGIIGGNGAGKSTALKLLTKILRPTRGTALVEGRVGSLIEVSAGFHPDLTGRENVFLQGAIMGMPQQLIRERFDDIIEFSGISAFIDTPVKRYSSGMNARLGFSIAVHLEPDVLIIDEVLSVGDAEFQERAFGRIKGLVQGNIPVAIVSHQLDRIVELCSSAILLTKGEVTAVGQPAHVVHKYLGRVGDHGGPTPSVEGLQLATIELPSKQPIVSGEPLRFSLTGDMPSTIPEWLDVLFIVRNPAANALVYQVSHRQAQVLDGPPGVLNESLALNTNLQAGIYLLEVLIQNCNTGVNYYGPSTFFEVVTQPSFAGAVQLSLRKG